MPYARFDRETFIARTGLGPDMNVLIIGPDCPTAVQIARGVETAVAVEVVNPQQARGLQASLVSNLVPVVAEYTRHPFKSGMFDIIFSYHALNNTPPERVLDMLGEVKRMLKPNSRFASLVWSLKPTNKAQSSHLMLLEILSRLEIIHLHGFDQCSQWLEAAGFDEITMELVPHQITVPDNWVQLHLKRLDEIMDTGDISTDLKEAVESYRSHVKEYGEELLPSIQFTASRGTGLAGIDIVE